MKPGKYVVFALDGERYGIPIEDVQQILQATPVTRIPNAPAYTLGVIDLRGETLPVVDARALLGLPAGTYQSFIVVAYQGSRAAITVDAVDRIQEFLDTQVEETGEWDGNSPQTFVGKTKDALTILLDPKNLVPHHETSQEEEAIAA